MRASQLHCVGHEVVTPSQVTYPDSKFVQSASTAVQLVLPEQETEGSVPQLAVALQKDFVGRAAGRLATWRTPLGCVAQELATGWPRIAARTSLVRGGRLGVWAKAATVTKRRIQARIHGFFIGFSFWVRLLFLCNRLYS
jgi:hypothetical protein